MFEYILSYDMLLKMTFSEGFESSCGQIVNRNARVVRAKQGQTGRGYRPCII